MNTTLRSTVTNCAVFGIIEKDMKKFAGSTVRFFEDCLRLHCNKKLKPYNIWYLASNDDFEDRRLYLYVCSRCRKPLAELIETHKADGLVKYSFWKKGGFDKITEALQNDVLYTSLNINKKTCKKTTYSWLYGINKEVKRKSGISEIRQYAKDFFAQSELIKKLIENESLKW